MACAFDRIDAATPRAREIRAVLWDVGGTLVEHVADYEQMRCAALADCGIDPRVLTPQVIERAKAFEADEALWRTPADEIAGWRRHAAVLLSDSDASERQIDLLGARLARYFDIYRPVSGIGELLRDLRDAGLRQAAVSNWPPSLHQFLEHHGLGQWFDAVASSAQVGASKPSAKIFQHAMEQLQVSASETIFIGNDPEQDIAPARALGMRAIHFDPRGASPQREADSVHSLRAFLRNLIDA